MNEVNAKQAAALPSQYPYVAEDILQLCRPKPGVWLDIGAGGGGLGLALAERSPGSVALLMDPKPEALQNALSNAGELGIASRVVTVVGFAEDMPLPDACVDLVVSRGSLFFWRDRAKGIGEAYRVLRPGGRAMLGGGLGRGYPAWARAEFIRRQRRRQRSNGPEAMRAFREARSRETFERLAVEAAVPDFAVFGEGGLDEDEPDAGSGIWLRFTKEE